MIRAADSNVSSPRYGFIHGPVAAFRTRDDAIVPVTKQNYGPVHTPRRIINRGTYRIKRDASRAPCNGGVYDATVGIFSGDGGGDVLTDIR